MHHYSKSMAIAALLLGAMNSGQASAQASGGPYRIESVVIAGGGGPIAGGNYQVTSTLGQPANGVSAGGNYVIFDGFWRPVAGFFVDFVFADSYESN